MLKCLNCNIKILKQQQLLNDIQDNLKLLNHLFVLKSHKVLTEKI